ncbi:hypothetical protein [Companilactobacillus sp. HBUAS56257]|uniref:hypothetical protein n=1 Tax=Companilactobacillus sp. HBUAS56257 TaxID=3109360 RepID=UPI002FF2E182
MLLDRKYFRQIVYILFYFGLTVLMYQMIKADVVWYGDDTYYHFLRIINLSDNFQNGFLRSNVALDGFGRMGYGINLFYPWLTLLPFYLMNLLTGDWIAAYYLGLAFYFFVSFLIGHYSMKKFSGNTFEAVIFAVVYNFSTYRLIEFFSRAALAEFLATVFLPLCFLGFYELFFGKGRNWQVLAIGMSLVVLSHVLTTLMCLIMFVLIALIFIKQVKFNKYRLQNLFKAIIATVLMTAIFSIPFVIETLSQKYGMPSPQKLIGKDFFALVQASFFNESGRQFEGHLYNVGTVILLGLIFGLFFWKKLERKYQAIYLMSILTFVMATKVFPWTIFNKTPIQVIQFPFRFLMFTTLFGSIIISVIIGQIIKTVSLKIPITLIFLVAIIGLWGMSFKSALVDSYIADDNLVISQKMIQEKKIPENYLEQYVPRNAQDKLSTIEGHVLMIDGNKSHQKPQKNQQENVFILKDVKKDNIIDLPYIAYRYTHVLVNGQRVNLIKSKRGTVRFQVPQDYHRLKIEITYLFPMNRVIMIISLVTWLYVIATLIYEKTQNEFGT